MDTLYEKHTSPQDHTIQSNHALVCAETGRVIAVFYREYDLDELMKQLQRLKDNGLIENQ